MVIGTTLGPYTLVAKLGEGGMGQVFRARDTALDRDVAIKVLPESVAGDADRIARFTREARTLASLNHPHIAAIYGVEERDGVRALVMELVEGEDLSAMMARGPIALPETLAIARQIADALAAAHEQGIVHRDLKPANIKVRPDGTVKVLDFGLAKVADPAASGVDVANSPTLTVRATQMSMILGTAAYMAPEQAKGRAVDRRADIWAFGVVLYEMLTGQRAFKGDDVSDTLASVLKDTLDLAALPASTPARLKELLARCLQKDPRLRQRDMGDVGLDLGAIVPGQIETARVPGARLGSPLVMVAALAGVLSLGLIGGWMWRGTSGGLDTAAVRFSVTTPDQAQATWPLITADGRTVMFGAGGRLYRRSIDAFEVVAIPGTDGARTPMLAPDGRSIAFFADRKLKRLSLAGGDPVAIADADGNMPGACWCRDDLILFSVAWSTGLSAVPAGGGPVRPITTPDASKGERAHWRPRPLPGGRRAVFTIMMAATGVNDARVAVLDVDTGQYRALFPGTDPLYLESGHLLYFHGGAWHVVQFDAAAGKATGQPETVLPDAYGVPPDGGNAGHLVSVSDSGVVAYRPGPTYPPRELAWMNRSGAIEPLGLPPHPMQDAALSPDSRRVALTRVEGGTYAVWIADIARKTEDRLEVKGSNFAPKWDPSGTWLAFVSERKGEYDTYVARPDGSGERVLLNRDYDEQPSAWSADGRRVLVKEWPLDGSTPLLAVDAGTGASREILLPNSEAGLDVQVSPDGRWFLYSGSQAGQPAIYVRALAHEGAAVRVSTDWGVEAFWAPDGREVFYKGRDAVMAASFREEGGRIDISVAKPLVSLPSSSELYGVGSDGRFLVGRLVGPEPPPGIRLVLNWFSSLPTTPPQPARTP